MRIIPNQISMIAAYDGLDARRGEYDLSESSFNSLGYKFLRADRKAEAIQVFRWAASRFPDTWFFEVEARLDWLQAALPPRHVRSEEQNRFQQFSTPILAWLMAKACGIEPGDVVLEPSAGRPIRRAAVQCRPGIIGPRCWRR